MNDIVTTLRALASGLVPAVEEKAMRDAADAIERLTAERDEARREICVMLEDATNNHRENHAKRWGWDCFKQDFFVGDDDHAKEGL